MKMVWSKAKNHILVRENQNQQIYLVFGISKNVISILFFQMNFNSSVFNGTSGVFNLNPLNFVSVINQKIISGISGDWLAYDIPSLKSPKNNH